MKSIEDVKKELEGINAGDLVIAYDYTGRCLPMIGIYIETSLAGMHSVELGGAGTDTLTCEVVDYIEKIPPFVTDKIIEIYYKNTNRMLKNHWLSTAKCEDIEDV